VNQSEVGRPPLPGRPEHDVVFDLGWERGPVRLRYGFDVVLGMRADATGTITVPDRTLHQAGVRLNVPPVRGLSLSFDVRNLFDERVVRYPNAIGATDPYPIGDLYDYPLPGRRFLATARWVGLTRPLHFARRENDVPAIAASFDMRLALLLLASLSATFAIPDRMHARSDSGRPEGP
jgi:hypothetical protein